MTNESITTESTHRKPQTRKRRASFVERTINGLSRRLESALYAEEMAKVSGLLQHLDPRVKVGGMLAMVIAVALSRNIKTILGVFVFSLVLALLSRVPIRVLATRIWLGALFFTGLIAFPALFITPGEILYRLPVLGWPITLQGLRSAVFLLTRVETTVTLVLLVVLCTPWTSILKALYVLGVPVVLIVILGMTYRYIFLLLRTSQDMFVSRQSRMIGHLDGTERRRLAAASVGVLLTKSFHLSGEVYLAMRSRGFRGEVYTLDEFRMSPRDWLALLGFISFAIFIVWAGR